MPSKLFFFACTTRYAAHIMIKTEYINLNADDTFLNFSEEDSIAFLRTAPVMNSKIMTIAIPIRYPHRLILSRKCQKSVFSTSASVARKYIKFIKAEKAVSTKTGNIISIIFTTRLLRLIPAQSPLQNEPRSPPII